MKSRQVQFMGRCGAVVGALMLLAACGGNGTATARTVGGTVSGLSGTLVLQNNAGDDLTLKADGSFTFATTLTAGSAYAVSVQTQPLWQNCAVSQSSGRASASVSNVTITCSTAAARVSTLTGIGSHGRADGNSSVASFDSPAAVVVRPDGSLVVSDSGTSLLRSVSPTGHVTTLAGGGPGAGVASVDGNGANASFNGLGGLALAASGNIYAADLNGHRIREIKANADVATFAGSGVLPGSADGDRLTAATFNLPIAVAAGPGGDLYVLDYASSVVRKIGPDGYVSTLAGSGTRGFAEGQGNAASFQYPNGIAVDKAGNVYLADSANGRIRKITPAGVVSTLAGSDNAGNADGVGASASFVYPTGLAVDNDGNVYVADFGANLLRMITPAGLVSTIAGQPFATGAQDGVGAAARFNQPFGVAIGPDGALYIADMSNHKIRKLTPVRTP